MGEEEPATEYGLVYPFVVCRSAGGPYEDQSFVAGVQAGMATAALTAISGAGGDGYHATVYPPLVAQLELIAMHHGFHHTATETFNEDGFEDEHPGEWVMWSCWRRRPPEDTGPEGTA